MSKITVGPINKGIKTDRTAFVIDNDSFPVLFNAYQWRGRVKRKRGTKTLGRLTRFFNSLLSSYNSGSTTITLDGSGNGNLLTGFSLQTNGNIVPGSVTITNGGNNYIDPAMNGTLSPSGSINYATGAITILAEANNPVSAVFRYFPDLPVLGLEDLILPTSQFPGTMGFDTTYSYIITNTAPAEFYDVSFYKNPAPDATLLPGYVAKTNETPTSWNGQDYRQFWTVNYEGALWATNGIPSPFTVTTIGMQYKAINNVSMIVVGPPATCRLTITAHGLVNGDFLFLNELPKTVVTGINFQTCYVTNVFDANNVDVEFPLAVLGGAGGPVATGIAQYLTNRSDITKDCIRFYDGDPTNSSSTAPVLNGTKGWVNFAPPLSQSLFSISSLPAAQYYLVGAKMIAQYKDRLLFIGPVVQTSASGSQIYLKDTVIYSQNGTPYYTASFAYNSGAPSDPTLADIIFQPMLVPVNQTATAPAWFEDNNGFGGSTFAGIDEEINTVSSNEDVLILGCDKTQMRFVYSGNDILPFIFYIINSELGSGSTFSSINMDRGVITVGTRGIIITSQVEAQRIDLEIPDEVFQINLSNNGMQRICAQRDFISEWVYFTYPSNNLKNKYPNQTLQYNYRDGTWAIFRESYTTYGQYRKQTGFTWATVGQFFPTWASWNQPWNASQSTQEQPLIIAGNQQGFVLIRNQGTNEGKSLYIRDIVGNVFTAPNHCLNTNDYIIINDCIGSVSSQVNGKIFKVINKTDNTFEVNPPINSTEYLGKGQITRMYVPFIQTKQFPPGWEMSRKTRLGVQQYLFTTTASAQVTLQIYLSQNANSAYNLGSIVPAKGSVNDSLIYSTVLYTCPESSNIGLTPANTNLNLITAEQQAQTWHRINTSLIGDTVQIGITLSDEQMRDENFNFQFAEIELHGFILDVSPSQVLA